MDTHIISPFSFSSPTIKVLACFVSFYSYCASANLLLSAALLLIYIFSVLQPSYSTSDPVISSPSPRHLPLAGSLGISSLCEWVRTQHCCPPLTLFYLMALHLAHVCLFLQYWEHSMAYIQLSCQSTTASLAREKKQG